MNLDFKADPPFPVTKELLVRADNIVYLTAVCTICGRPATRSQRLIDRKPAPRDSPVILVGGGGRATRPAAGSTTSFRNLLYLLGVSH